MEEWSGYVLFCLMSAQGTKKLSQLIEENKQNKELTEFFLNDYSYLNLEKEIFR